MDKVSVFFGVRFRCFAWLMLLWGIMIGLEVVDQTILGGSLDRLGTLPRNPDHWYGIFLAPLLHGSYNHLFNNMVGLCMLTIGLVLSAPRDAMRAIAVIWVLTGAGVWLIGSPGFHIGASGVLYGLIGFLVVRGIAECRYGNGWSGFFTLLVSIPVAIIFWGALPGILPGQPGISWEAHFVGLVSGAITPFLIGKVRKGLKSDKDNV